MQFKSSFIRTLRGLAMAVTGISLAAGTTLALAGDGVMPVLAGDPVTPVLMSPNLSPQLIDDIGESPTPTPGDDCEDGNVLTVNAPALVGIEISGPDGYYVALADNPPIWTFYNLHVGTYTVKVGSTEQSATFEEECEQKVLTFVQTQETFSPLPEASVNPSPVASATPRASSTAVPQPPTQNGDLPKTGAAEAAVLSLFGIAATGYLYLCEKRAYGKVARGYRVK